MEDSNIRYALYFAVYEVYRRAMVSTNRVISGVLAGTPGRQDTPPRRKGADKVRFISLRA